MGKKKAPKPTTPHHCSPASPLVMEGFKRGGKERGAIAYGFFQDNCGHAAVLAVDGGLGPDFPHNGDDAPWPVAAILGRYVSCMAPEGKEELLTGSHAAGEKTQENRCAAVYRKLLKNNDSSGHTYRAL